MGLMATRLMRAAVTVRSSFMLDGDGEIRCTTPLL